MEKTLLPTPDPDLYPGPTGALSLRRKCACESAGGGCPACEDESKDRLRRASLGPAAGGRAPSIVNEVLTSPGRPLDHATRAFMEPRFGRSFEDVRVHTDSRASDSAWAVQALAYTVGKDVVFGAGNYAPETREGRSLLAHELTHVAQNGGASPGASTPISIGPEGDAYETQADQAANSVASGEPQGPVLISATHQSQRARLSRAQFTVGNATVNIDYGNLTALARADYQSAIETNYASFTGGQAADIHTDVAALTDRGREWVLYALDLLVDNPATGLDKVQAVKRLIGYAPGAKFWAAGSSDGGAANANEALSVAGWFEKALTSGLTALSSVRQSFVQQRLNPNTSSSGGSACPSPRPASEQLDSAKLKSDMPPQLEAYLKKVVVPTNVKTQSMTPLLKVADAVQARARSFYSPYADHSRGSGNTLVQQWQYSSHLVSSQSSAGTPNTDLRLAFLDSRARKVGDQGLFATVHFDARCDADETVLDEIVHTMEPQSTIRALVDPILRQKSYTEQSAAPKQVVLNPQVDAQTDECTARWQTIRTLCHELMHVMTHDDFRRAEKGRQIMTEGFPEVLGHYLYLKISADASLKKTMEDGLASAPCQSVPGSKIEYDPGGPKAEEIRIAVKDDNFRAAFFLGQLSLAGIQPKLIAGSNMNDPLEAQAERAADSIMNGERSQTRAIQRKGACGETREADQQSHECASNSLFVQRSSLGENQSMKAPPIVDEVLHSPGQPLDQATRTFFEPRFGHDFSRVRVHTDARAAESAGALNSLAFTLGNDIVFGAAQFSPGTDRGRRLLAHELTHVVQQGPGVAAQGSADVARADDPHEREADSIAERVLNGMSTARVTPQAIMGQGAIRRKCPPLPQGSSGCVGATAAKAQKAKGPPEVPEFTVGGSNRVQWRVSYGKKKETEAPLAHLKHLHISAEEPFQDGKQWTFCYCPMSKSEAESEAKKKQIEFGDKINFTAKFDAQAKSFFVEAELKCPQAIPAKAGFDIWDHCFGEKEAKALLKKFNDSNVQAEVFKLDERQFGLYFKPMSEPEAKKAGQEAASKRGGFAEGMFNVETAKSDELKTHTYRIKTSCPKGFTEKTGGFRVTTYVLAQEKEFAEKPTVKDPCGLKGTFRKDFLLRTGQDPPLGVKKEGSGISLSGKIIQYVRTKGGGDCFQIVSCPKTAVGTCATVGRTVAVDESEIPLKSTVLIEDVGLRVAEDTGGQVNDKHIDVYRGTELTGIEANKVSLKNKKVCVKR